MQFKQNGFTLAEVLITLTIIGIIAVLTIPNLMHKHQEQEFIQKLKKNYTVFSNAYLQAIRENGNPDEWNIGTEGSATGAEKLYMYLKPYLKIEKECKFKGNGCFATTDYKALSGVKSEWSYLGQDSSPGFYRFLLSDSTSVSIWSAGTGCGNNNDFCGYIFIDTNNQKGPNIFGVDVFMFDIRYNNIVPTGTKTKITSDGKQCTFKNTHARNGATCASYVFKKGNMDYLRRDISNEW